MSQLALFADLSTRKLVTSDGGTVTLPTFVLGDQCICTLRLLDKPEGEALRERDLNVRTLRASIGRVLEPPTSGGFKLRLNNEASAEVKPGTSAADVQSAIQAIDDTDEFYDLQEVVAAGAGCWLLHFANATAIPLSIAENTLQPESFVRFRAFEQNGHRWHELRLIQTPLVFTGSHDRVLPPPPSVKRIREGTTDGEFKINEIQALIVPADFRGTYYIRWDFRTTKLLGIEDGPEEIAEALNKLFGDNKTRFEVSNPEPDHAYVEFVGELSGEPQPLMSVSVHSFQPGTLTFTLDFNRGALASALRTTPEIELPLEIELEVVDDGEDAENPAIPGRLITLFQQKVKIAREQIWEELAEVPATDWLKPPLPRDYIPFTREQVLTGQQHSTVFIGDGVNRSIAVPHGLATDALAAVLVRERAAGGRVLVHGIDYEFRITDENEVVVEIPQSRPVPAPQSLALTITTAGPRSAFARHLHYIAEIIGLEEALYIIGARLSAIEDLLPHVRPAAPTAESKPIEIEIPDRYEFFPGRLPANFDPKSVAEGKSTTTLPRAAGLLPAIHDATVQPITVPLPPAFGKAGEVFRNDTNTPLLVPGGLGRRGGYLEPGGFAGSDGRVWYRLSRAGTTNSFFPTDFERELFLFHVNERMLRASGSLSLEFDLALQLFQANTRGQYLLVIELGQAPGQDTPAPTAENLRDVEWQAVPLLSQRIIVSSLQLKHHFGASIRRDLNGTTFFADRLLYTVWEGGAPVPGSPNFVVRARLVQWDTENSVRGAKGNVFYALTDAKAEIQ